MLFNKLYVGLDIGSTSLKIVGFTRNRQGYVLKFHEVVDLVEKHAPESFYDLTDELLVDEMLALKSKYKLQKSDLRLVLPGRKAAYKSLQVQAEHGEAQILTAVAHAFDTVTADENSDLEIACQEMETAATSAESISLFACAVPKSTLFRFKHLLQQAGLQASVMDVDALAIYNVFHYTQPRKEGPATIVHIGSQFCTCITTMPDAAPFFKTIKLAGNDITKRIMEETGLNYARADKLKRKIYQSKWAGSKPFLQSRLADIYREFTGLVSAEVKKCIRHYQSTLGVAESGDLYLTGGGVALGTLQQSLCEELQTGVNIWNPLTTFLPAEQAQTQDSELPGTLRLTPALGAVLRGR